MTTYNTWSEKVAGIINKHWPIICYNFGHIEKFQVNLLMLYKRPTNLRDKLFKSFVGPSLNYNKDSCSNLNLVVFNGFHV